jgi:hypothetical protein
MNNAVIKRLKLLSATLPLEFICVRGTLIMNHTVCAWLYDVYLDRKLVNPKISNRPK